jgi:ribonuclease J
MSTNELVFLPLGGSNEIGMNLNLYGFGPATTVNGSSPMSA